MLKGTWGPHGIRVDAGPTAPPALGDRAGRLGVAVPEPASAGCRCRPGGWERSPRLATSPPPDGTAHHPGRASRPLLTPAWHLARPQSHTRHASTSIPLTRRGAGPDAQLRAGARPAPRPDAKPAHPRSFRRHPFCLTYPESFHALTAPLDKLSPGFEGHQKAHLQVLSPDGPTLLAQALAGVPPMEASPPRGGPGVWPTLSCRLGRSFQAEGEQRAGA